MFSKLTSLADAAKLIQDGQTISLSGNALHRNPAAFARELAKLNRNNLKIMGAAHGYAADILCATGAVSEIYFGFCGFENEYGLAPGIRQAIQSGSTKAIEGSCAAMIASLRGASYGLPFMGIGGLWGSDLLKTLPEFYRVIKSPFDGQEVVCVKSVQPDWAIIHVQEADEYGNARILASEYQDIIFSRAAKKTIITAEKIVSTEKLQENPKLTSIPHFLVEAVVLAPQGAKPGICYPDYVKVDDKGMKAYIRAVKDHKIPDYLATFSEGEEA